MSWYEFFGDRPEFGLLTSVSGLVVSQLLTVVGVPVWLEVIETVFHILLMLVTAAVGITTIISWIDKKGYFKKKFRG
jgi:hypothetical protein